MFYIDSNPSNVCFRKDVPMGEQVPPKSHQFVAGQWGYIFANSNNLYLLKNDTYILFVYNYIYVHTTS